jgi:predicted  nucleic acid-binding Zn-ribbon protein
MAKDKQIKLTEEELKSLNDLRDSYSNNELAFGRLEVQRLNLEKTLDSISDRKLRLELEYAELQKAEKELVDSFDEKYGAGNLDPNTGVFTPIENN